ncbi:hypothetical protein KH017_17050 [bacterium]|nr:hypothetical protein [bacterium]
MGRGARANAISNIRPNEPSGNVGTGAERRRKQAAAEKKSTARSGDAGRKSRELKLEAYHMARTVIRKHLRRKFPDNIGFGTQDDCVITWQQYEGPNRFCVKMAMLDRAAGARDYIFVDLDYLGNEKWNVLAIRK